VRSRPRTLRALAMMSLFLLPFLLSACDSGWEKKFIRKREKPPRKPQFEVEAVQRPFPELYKEHFTYWKNWHGQLLQDLGTNHKRELMDVNEARRHLVYLQKYLHDDKARDIGKHVEEFDRVTKRLRESRMSGNDYEILKRRLESMQANIHRVAHPKRVKQFFLPTPIPVNLAKYQEEEPTTTAAAGVKVSPAAADTGKDESSPLTYEKFRNLPAK